LSLLTLAGPKYSYDVYKPYKSFAVFFLVHAKAADLAISALY